MFNYISKAIDVALLIILGMALFIASVYGLDLLFGWPSLSIQSFITGMLLLGVFPGFIAYMEKGIRGLVTACFIQIFVVGVILLLVFVLLYSIDPSITKSIAKSFPIINAVYGYIMVLFRFAAIVFLGKSELSHKKKSVMDMELLSQRKRRYNSSLNRYI